MDLELRETTLDDLPILFEHQRDPVANEMAVFAARDWDAFVAHDAKIRSDPTLIRRTVVVDDKVVGSIGCFGDEQREVWYWYDRAVWGRGIGTAALAAFLDDVTERPMFAHVAVTNVGSAKVLERCGFVDPCRPGGSTLIGARVCRAYRQRRIVDSTTCRHYPRSRCLDTE